MKTNGLTEAFKQWAGKRNLADTRHNEVVFSAGWKDGLLDAAKVCESRCGHESMGAHRILMSAADAIRALAAQEDQRESNSNPAPVHGQSKTGLTESHSGAPTPQEQSAPYYLIERGSPAEWLSDLRFKYPVWTSDSSKAMRFATEEAALQFNVEHELDESADAFVTEHVDVGWQEQSADDLLRRAMEQVDEHELGTDLKNAIDAHLNRKEV